MPRGGKRQGSGRKKGIPNRRTQELQDKVASSGLTPLDYMLGVLRDDEQTIERRDWAAKEAAPYIHAKLASVAAKHDVSDALADLLKAVDGRTRGLPSGS